MENFPCYKDDIRKYFHLLILLACKIMEEIKMHTYRHLALLITSITLLVLCSACPDRQKTYNNYGMSFQYPPDMKITEKKVLDNAVTEKSGELELVSNEEPFRVINILWVTPPSKDKTSPKDLEELLSKLEGKAVFETEPSLETHGEIAVIEKRYVVIHRIGFLRSKGIFSCKKLNRVVLITATRSTEGIIKYFPGMKLEDIKIPLKTQDPVYQDYRKILESFRCNAL